MAANRKSTFLPPMAEALPSFFELFFGDLDLPWNYSRLVQGLVMLIATMHGGFGGEKRWFLPQPNSPRFETAKAIFNDRFPVETWVCGRGLFLCMLQSNFIVLNHPFGFSI